ncbi:MAG: hypothetical protein ACYC4Q_06015 [Victivallaceae bacterium]
MKKQPDFNQIFYDYFGANPQKVAYSIRPDSNRYHDLTFIRSLIHDGKFKKNEIKILGKRLVIPINRDCWELGLKDNELYIADSRLSISPVFDLEWNFTNEMEFNPDAELWIRDLSIQRESDDMLKIVLDGYVWSLQMKAFDDDFKMKLQDLEVPYLYSQKNMT